MAHGGGARVRVLMDPGLQPASPAPHRSRAARRAEALRTETAATAALNVLGQKWVLRIIRSLGDRTQRFCELQDALGGANSATLSQRLKMLEDEGLIERRAISAVPPWVEYSLTPLGWTITEPLMALAEWDEAHADEVSGARLQYRYDPSSGNGNTPHPGRLVAA